MKNKEMKILIMLIVAFFISLSASGQVTRYLGTKGEVVEFDSAIVIRLSAYRKEFRSMQAKDSVINTLRSFCIHEKNRNSIMAKEDIRENPEGVVAQPVAPPTSPVFRKWYFNPLLYLGAGLLLGVYVVD